MDIFDLHCDTLYEIAKRKLPLDNSETSVSLGQFEKYKNKYQVFAYWSSDKKSDRDCLRDFILYSEYLDGEVEKNDDKCKLCTHKADLDTDVKLGIIKCVEGGRLLCGDLSNIELLYKNGVRVFIPVWQGVEPCGGAWDTDVGLSDFGKRVVSECQNKGIIIDTSHMSEKSFYNTLEISKAPIVASHSNSASVCRVKRNITNEQFSCIRAQGGLVGISLAAKHISDKYENRMPDESEDFIGDVFRHIEHYLCLSGENTIALGTDFDGTERTKHLPDTASLERLYEQMLRDNINEETVNKIFYGNAKRFFTENLK